MVTKTVIFGASNFGEIVFDKIKNNHEIIAFCDNDSKKWTKKLHGKRIISVEELMEMYRRNNGIKIIIASSYYLEILNQLSVLGVSHVYVSFLKNDINPLKGTTHRRLTIKKYDISDLSSLKIIENRIGLIVRNHSGSNTLSLWKFIPNRIKERFEVIVIYENEDKLEYYKKLYSCKVIVTTHSNNLNLLKDLKNRIYIQLWHGLPMKGVGRLDKTVPEVNEERIKTWQSFDKITSYSHFFTTVISGCFGGNISNYEVTGAPRNDLLLFSKGREKLSDMLDLELSDKKVIYYMPTFRLNKYHTYKSGNKNFDNIFGFPNFNIKGFLEFLKEHDLLFIVKMHPYEETYIKKIISKYNTENIKLILDENLKNIDFYEILNACDLLITDYSSVFYDYLLLDRPIIFTPVDIRDYELSTGMLYGPYDFWTPGDKVYNQQELQRKIFENLFLEDKYHEHRKTIKNIVHHFKDDKSIERVWKLIEQTYDTKIKAQERILNQ